ncbi:hypothetical protein GF373_17055 [bacterium]|nr:hypothetical protein [bacterium]
MDSWPLFPRVFPGTPFNSHRETFILILIMEIFFWYKCLDGITCICPKKALGIIAGLIFLVGTGPFTAHAGNPMVTLSGKMLQWTDRDITYHIDRGDLGPFPAEYIQSLVMKAFTEWNDTPNATLSIQFGGLLKDDVTRNNLGTYLSNPNDGLNPVILDSDGAIIEQLFGKEASNSFLGIGGPLYDEINGEIFESEAIINGKFLTDRSSEIERAYSTLLHEFGHFLGLDHSQLHVDFAFDDDPVNNLFLPAMFPVEPEDRFATQSLLPDDRFTLSYAYPDEEKMDQFASISGVVARPFGDIVQGANVVAVKVDSPLIHTYSIVSDLFINQTGEFAFLFLPPGEYELFIEPIFENFWNSSGVGPFTDSPNSPSFIDPVIKEYYNGPRENGFINRDNPQDKVTITVNAGESEDNILFISNEEKSASNFVSWYLYE